MYMGCHASSFHIHLICLKNMSTHIQHSTIICFTLLFHLFRKMSLQIVFKK